MTRFLNILAITLLSAYITCCLATPGLAGESAIADRIYGKTDAPITVDEYISLTCSHCADFYNNILPSFEKTYIENGKVRFILHDFPLDGVALKAAVIARCMPEDEYYPFIKLLYKNQASWAFGNTDPENTLIQYAKLGGLSDDKAKACLQDTRLEDAVIAERTTAGTQYDVQATPTFVINGGTDVIKGAQPATAFAAIFDRLLDAKK